MSVAEDFQLQKFVTSSYEVAAELEQLKAYAGDPECIEFLEFCVLPAQHGLVFSGCYGSEGGVQ